MKILCLLFCALFTTSAFAQLEDYLLPVEDSMMTIPAGTRITVLQDIQYAAHSEFSSVELKSNELGVQCFLHLPEGLPRDAILPAGTILTVVPFTWDMPWAGAGVGYLQFEEPFMIYLRCNEYVEGMFPPSHPSVRELVTLSEPSLEFDFSDSRWPVPDEPLIIGRGN